jgi:hypothetical protein
MGYTKFLVAAGMITASPAVAAQPDPAPQAGAPAASSDARYCLRVGPLTGSVVESVMCETRDTWVQLGVDVDREWAKEGVRVIAPRGSNS